MAVRQEEQKAPDFEHELAILPNKGAWYVYIDEPTRWWRAYDSLEHALSGVAFTLDKLLTWERGDQPKWSRHPLSNSRKGVAFPAVAPRWRIRVTADLGEDQPEWRLEVLDDATWSTSGYDLKDCMSRLARRLQFVSGTELDSGGQENAQEPKPFTLPAVAAALSPAPAKEVAPVLTGSIEDLMTSRLEAIRPEIVELERRRREVTLEIEKSLTDLRREQRAIQAARSAYREKTYKHRKSAGEDAE